MARKKVVKKAAKKICSACGAENSRAARKCVQCEKTRFEPDWVRAKRNINRQFSVQITASNPKYGKSRKRITLSKWWPRGRAFLNIPDSAQWLKIADIIENDLGPLLGWSKKAEFVATAKARAKEKKSQNKDLRSLVHEQPDFLKDLIEAIDPKKLGESDLNSLSEILAEISDAFTNANAGFREAFFSVVKKLPRQKQRAIEDLNLLLQGWSLHIITNVAQQVRARIETIELFEKQVNDERTYEIRGDNSIHRILERAMWLVDERYWLLYSNKTLLQSIGKEMQKRDKKRYGKKRPDFVCGTVGKKLILLELKRPSHTLSVDDLNQLEQYVIVAKKYFSFSIVEAYLVGSKINPDLQSTLELRSKAFRVLTYADLLDGTKKRYHEYLTAME